MLLLVVTGSAKNLYAATVSPNSSTQSGNNGLQISPTRTDLAVNRGEVTTFQISLKNVSSINLIAKAELNDFQSDNQTGNPKLLVNTKQRTDRSVAPFVKGVADVPLSPGQTKNLSFTVDVPQNAAPGGYYGAIRYSAVPVNPKENTGPSQVSLTASVASLVLMEINGPVNETLTLDSITAIRDTTEGTFFFGKGPNKVSIKLSNKGNGFAQPLGHVYIMKGSKQVYSYEFNSNAVGLHSSVLPYSSRVFTDPIKNTSAFGQYKIIASIAYKQGNETVTVTQRFWVIPKGVAIILIIILILIAVAIAYFIARRRRSKRSTKV